MELSPYVERIRHQLLVAADAGGDEARAGAERLVAPLEPAVRLAVLDALIEAAQEITCELAPGSVEVRMRGRDPEFAITLPPPDHLGEEADGGRRTWSGTTGGGTTGGAGGGDPTGGGAVEAEDAAVARINLRLPDRLKARVEAAAAGDGLSINAWLVRAVAAAVDQPPPRRERSVAIGGQHFTGWAR